MQAQVGDEISVYGRNVGEPDRMGVITEVRGAEGAPPYVVRWNDGREAVFFPGPGSKISKPKADAAAR